MKIFYLIGALFFTVIILIVSFENISAICTQVQFFFYTFGATVSPTFLIFGLSLIGMVAGAFYFGFVMSLFKSSDQSGEEDDENF